MVLLIIVLIVIGVVLTLFRPSIDARIYQLIIVLIVLAIALYILNAFGLVELPPAFRLGKP